MLPPLLVRVCGCCLFAITTLTITVFAQDVTVFAPVLKKPDGTSEVLPAPAKAWKVDYPKERAKENEIGSGFLVAYVGAQGLTIEDGRGAERAYAYEAHTTAKNGLGVLDLKWPGEGFGYVWRAVIFNPASAKKEGPNATPRLLAVEPVFLSSRLMAAGGFLDLNRKTRMGKLKIATDGSVESVTVLGDKRLSGTGHQKRDRQPLEMTDELREAIESVVRRWRFAPARKDGVNVEAEIFVKIPIWLDPHDVFGTDEIMPQISPEGRAFAVKPSVVKRHKLDGGRVTVEFIVSEEGLVRVPKVISATHTGMDELAFEVLDKWRFDPVKRDRAPASARMRHTFHFSSDDRYLLLSDMQDDAVPPCRVTDWRIKFPDHDGAWGRDAKVIAEVEIDAEGRPRDPAILHSSQPVFNEVMIDGILKTGFRPGLRNGEPVPLKALVFVRFISGSGSGDYVEMEMPSKDDQSRIPPYLRFEKAPVPVNIANPVFPYKLALQGVEGSAVVVLMVDDQGRVTATHVSSCTQPEFGQALAAACEEYSFKPGLRDGRPARGLVSITHPFKLPSMDDGGYLAKMERAGGKGIVEPAALDRSLKPVARSAPVFPAALEKRRLDGLAMIEFLIDEKGRVQLPRVFSADDLLLGFAAMQAASQWRFEPPVKDGRPAVVRARLPFRFAAAPPAGK